MFRARSLAALALSACSAPPPAPDSRVDPGDAPAIALANASDDVRYAAVRDGDGFRFGATASRLDVRLDPHDVQLRALGTTASTTLDLRAWAHGGHPLPLASTAPIAEGPAVEFARDARLTEWFRHGPLGLEHGFVVHARPSDQDGLTFVIAAADPAPRPDGVALAGGAISYGHAASQDATGRWLPTTLGVRGDDVVLTVDDRGAVYPIAIDPLAAVTEQVITAPPPSAGDFGEDLLLHGDFLFASDHGQASPVVHVFRWDGAAFVLHQTLAPSSVVWGDGLAIAADGDTLVVGLEGESGAAQLYEFDGTDWIEGELIPDLWSVSARAYPAEAVAISGAWMAVAIAWMNESAEYGGYIGLLEHTTTWTETQRLHTPRFTDWYGGWGQRLALDGSVLVVGDSRANSWNGAVDVYTESGGVWTRLQTIGGAPLEYLGEFVDVDNDTIVALSIAVNQEPGFVAVYEPDGTGQFVEVDRLVPPTATVDFYGGLSVHGDTIAVAGWDSTQPTTNRGNVHLYTRVGAGWQYESTVTSTTLGSGALGWGLDVDDRFLVANDGSDVAIAAYPLAVIDEPDGTPCTDDVQCAGFCVDGVCCDSVCGGDVADDCLACSATAGATTDGVCTPLDGVACAGGTCGAGTCDIPCGDAQCGTGESCSSCPEDCGACCGNAALDGGEACDGALLSDANCQAIGYDTGALACTSSCTYDTAACVGEPPPVTCGNGFLDPGENCRNCPGDTEPCCGNLELDPGEDCDATGVFQAGFETCQDLTYTSGTLRCDDNCRIDTSDCTGDSLLCGNGILDFGEQCDQGLIGAASCATIDRGYGGGVLQCNDATCRWDASQCYFGDCSSLAPWGAAPIAERHFELDLKDRLIPVSGGPGVTLAITYDAEPKEPDPGECEQGAEITAGGELCLGPTTPYYCTALELEIDSGCKATPVCSAPPVAACDDSTACCEDRVRLRAMVGPKWRIPANGRYEITALNYTLAEGEFAVELQLGIGGELTGARAEGAGCNGCPSGVQYKVGGALIGTASASAGFTAKIANGEFGVSGAVEVCVRGGGELTACDDLDAVSGGLTGATKGTLQLPQFTLGALKVSPVTKTLWEVGDGC